MKSAFESSPCPVGTKRCNTCETGLTGRCHTKKVVYKIILKLCTEKPGIYIGESKRRVRETDLMKISVTPKTKHVTPLSETTSQSYTHIAVLLPLHSKFHRESVQGCRRPDNRAISRNPKSKTLFKHPGIVLASNPSFTIHPSEVGILPFYTQFALKFAETHSFYLFSRFSDQRGYHVVPR